LVAVKLPSQPLTVKQHIRDSSQIADADADAFFFDLMQNFTPEERV
jgi:hypothetical protein